MRLSRLLMLVLLAGVLLQAGAATRGRASAAVDRTDGWQPATTLFSATGTSRQSVSGPQVALDGRRRATAVWLNVSQHVLMDSDWTQNGGWTPARTLTALGTDVSDPPQLAVDAHGDAVLAWVANQQVRASYRSAGGDWQQPQTVSRPGETADYPRVALDARGRSLLMWTASRPSSSDLLGLSSGQTATLQVASRGRTGVWGQRKVMCACASVAALAMNASGHALVVWSPGTGLWSKTRTPYGQWSAAQWISPVGTGLEYLPLALNARGEAVVAWLGSGPDFGHLEIAIRGPRGPFGRTQTIGANPYWGFVLALAPTGEATVVWETDSDCGFAMSRFPGASSFGSPQSLECGFYGEFLPEALAMDARGNALALWLRADELYNTGHIHLRAAERPAGARFDAPSDIWDMGLDSYKHSGCRGDPSLAVTPDGHLALAVWLARPDDPGGCAQVQAATLSR